MVAEQSTLAIDTPQASDTLAVPKQRVVAKARKLTWSRPLPERMKTVANLLAESAAPFTTKQVAARIGGKTDQKTQLSDILATLVALGRGQQISSTHFSVFRRQHRDLSVVQLFWVSAYFIGDKRIKMHISTWS